MIKLELPDRPDKLTAELIKELTDKFKLDESDVWNRKFIRESVLDFSFGKCCYTECKLDEESKYMEVDHFLPKKHFPDEVVTWGNLLPACKKSNTTKGELNTAIYPIINPLSDNPKDHLFIRNFRFYQKTEIGRRTIDYVALNDRKHFVKKRFEIGLHVIEILEDLQNSLLTYIDDFDLNEGNIKGLVNRYKNLLNEATRKEEYSATLSTTILMDCNNQSLIEILQRNNYWDNELNELIIELEYCSLIA